MNDLHDNQKGGAYCPACKYFGYDCNVDEEEWTLPCDAYEERSQEHGPDRRVLHCKPEVRS